MFSNKFTYLLIFFFFCGLIFLLPSCVYGQLEGANWYFGNKAGIRFQGDSVIVLTDGEMRAEEGCASVSDQNGNLLFYTNGARVWNKQHQIMANGAVISDAISPTQVLIAPQPGNDSIFYVFVPEDILPGPSTQGLTYSIVNMAKNGGLGEVIAKNQLLLPNSSELVSMTRADNGVDLWIISSIFPTGDFYAYRLNCQGLDTTAMISQGFSTGNGKQGVIKMSPSGDFASVFYPPTDSVQIWDFSPASGTFSNPIYLSNLFSPTSLEFSPDDTKLFVSVLIGTSFSINQFDLTLGSQQSINSNRRSLNSIRSTYGSYLQRGIDGRIYVSNTDTTSLGVILSPDSPLVQGNLHEDEVFYSAQGNVAGFPGLPHIFPELPKVSLSETGRLILCENQPFPIQNTSQILPDFIEWIIFDNGNNPIQTFFQDSITLSMPAPGEYSLQLLAEWGCHKDSAEIQFTVLPEPKVELPDSVLLCGSSPVHLNPSGTWAQAQFSWSSGDSSVSVWVEEAGEYGLKIENICGADSSSTKVIRNEEVGLFIPNVFTPNGDGINEQLVIEVENPEDFHLQIFDRWGRKRFESHNPEHSWGGEEDENGVYFYVFEGSTCDGKTSRQTGYISLLR